MSELTTISTHRYPFRSIQIPAGGDSLQISQSAARAAFLKSPAALGSYSETSRTPSPAIEEALYNSRAALKLQVAAIAMHLNKEWRNRLFAQVDSLLDADEWDDRDEPVVWASFTTFLRMILLLKAKRGPGIGATSEGNIIAAWSVGRDRLTVECLPMDQIRWVLVRYLDDKRESAAGQTDLLRLFEVLHPYNHKDWFFDEEGAKASAGSPHRSLCAVGQTAKGRER